LICANKEANAALQAKPLKAHPLWRNIDIADLNTHNL